MSAADLVTRCVLACDHCPQYIEFSPHTTFETAGEWATLHGWWIFDHTHICPDCAARYELGGGI